MWKKPHRKDDRVEAWKIAVRAYRYKAWLRKSLHTHTDRHMSNLNGRTEQVCALNCMIPSASSGTLSSGSGSILPAFGLCVCVCVFVHLAWLSLHVAGNWTRGNKTRGRPTARRVGLLDRQSYMLVWSLLHLHLHPSIVLFIQLCFEV